MNNYKKALFFFWSGNMFEGKQRKCEDKINM